MDEEFFVAFRSQQRRFDRAQHVERCRRSGRLDLIDDAGVLFGAAHDAFADFLFADFELRFDQRDDLPALDEKVAHGGKDEAERNERCVDRRKLRRLRQEIGRKAADVGFLQDDNARIRSQLRCELAVADIDSVNALRAGGQQAIREPAGRGSDVERDFTGDRYMKLRERLFELVAAAADINVRSG
jgi:hypothetical protein